jgi:hypothetical protein
MEPSNTKLVECLALKILHSSPPSLKDPKKHLSLGTTFHDEPHKMCDKSDNSTTSKHKQSMNM